MLGAETFDIKESKLGQEFLVTSDVGLEYAFEVEKLPRNKFESTGVAVTGPFNKDMFGESTVRAYLRGSCLEHDSFIRLDAITQGYMLEIAIPYTKLPVLHLPGGKNSHRAKYQIQSMGGLTSSLSLIEEGKRETVLQRIEGFSEAKNPLSDAVAKLLLSKEEITENAHKAGISTQDIYTHYKNLQERYALGRLGEGGDRNVYKHGLPLAGSQTVNHCLLFYQELWASKVAGDDDEGAHFALLRLVTLRWWAEQLDLRMNP